MGYDGERVPAEGLLRRVLRLTLPWIGLIFVVAVLWGFVTDYRSAVDAPETTATVETTQTGSIPEGSAYVVVLSEGLNLRADPSTTAAVVRVLTLNEQLVFIEEGVGWYHVRDAQGVEGWVAAGGSYTELVEQ